MIFVYVIGAQCTGKTTLAITILDSLKQRHPELRCALLTETARHTLKKHEFGREDIRQGGDRCLQLQKLIMQEQDGREASIGQQSLDIVVSDRSGLDALVYADLYCAELAGSLQGEAYWERMRSRLRAGIVIVCEPVAQWLVDDGTRLMPQDWNEWVRVHDRFIRILQDHGIAYTVLSSSVESASDRTEFAIRLIPTNLIPLAAAATGP